MQDPLVNIAILAARAAGAVMTKALDRLSTIKVTEKSPNDFVTEVDQDCERDIIGIIRKNFPNHAIIAEESGEQGHSEYTWIIDPIDGTRNFIHGVPHFAVSIGIQYKEKLEHAVIYDPIRQELFTATRGKGARLNDRRIRVSQRALLKDSLLGTGFCFRHSMSNPNTSYIDIFNSLLPLASDIRASGSAVLDLAYVAAGRFDGFWECGLKLWDMAAGVLLIKEAGGLICDTNGEENYLTNGHIIAANPKLLKVLVKQINAIHQRVG